MNEMRNHDGIWKSMGGKYKLLDSKDSCINRNTSLQIYFVW